MKQDNFAAASIVHRRRFHRRRATVRPDESMKQSVGGVMQVRHVLLATCVRVCAGRISLPSLFMCCERRYNICPCRKDARHFTVAISNRTKPVLTVTLTAHDVLRGGRMPRTTSVGLVSMGRGFIFIWRRRRDERTVLDCVSRPIESTRPNSKIDYPDRIAQYIHMPYLSRANTKNLA
jgi:hypothetical protein